MSDYRDNRALLSTEVLTAVVMAVSVGALAVGALAIGYLAIGGLSVRNGKFKRLEIDELVVKRIRRAKPGLGRDKP